MKIENRDRLNNIRGIAHSIGVFTDQTEVIDRVLDSDRPLMIQDEGK